ncbi:hypothetical protein AB0958_19135 [Streptomyces sp. NPDC006655]|uniref:hypothetical protein n=1 Tax=Streptomyces sp. NPDC006655 TaxID=3156898 RepID=UPI003456326B
MPGFTATTQAIIEVIASRMCFDTGHARYVMKDVMERTGLGKTAVTDHVRMLRAGGWLAWVEHGSKRNALTRLGLGGYARTATVYAATIPPAYDALVGHVLVGTGYNARIIVDHRPKSPVDTAGNEAVENSGTAQTRTPSLWVDKEVGQVQVVGGEGTSTASAAASKSPRRKRKLTVTGYKITGQRIEQARQMTKSIRPLVNWVQRSTLEELSWVLMDLVARDWSQQQIVVWLGRLGRDIDAPRWRPRAPHRVIAAALHRMATEDAKRSVPAHLEAEEDMPTTAPNAAFAAARETLRARTEGTPDVAATVGEDDQVPLTDSEKWDLRDVARTDPGLVRSAARILGRDAAVAMYGTLGAQILDQHAEFTAAGINA